VRRPLFLIVLLLAIPGVALAAFDDPEVADPIFFVSDTIPDQLQVDSAGRAYFVSMADVPVGDPEDGDTDRQVIVYERCGTAWQVDSRHGEPDDGSFSTRPISLEVAASGDMLLTWLDGTNDEKTIFTRFRPAGGDWGAPHEVETLPVSNVMTDIAPNGDAVVAYVEDTGTADPVPLQVAVRTRSSGAWANDELGNVQALWEVTMSPSADALVLTADRTAQATTLDSWMRPAGGAWGARQEAAEFDTTNPLRTAVAFGPDGKAVLGVGVPDRFGIIPDTVVSAVRTAGQAGSWSGLTERSSVDDSSGGIVDIDAVTHPGGVVLGWIEKQAGAFTSDLALARFNGGGFEAPKVYDVDDQFIALSVGAAPSGEAIVAAQHETTSNRNRIVTGEAAGIAGAWPASLEEIPAPAGDHRDPRVGAGGIVAVAYGVHAGNDSRSEVVADGPSPSCSGGSTPTPTATATATASADPDPDPDPSPPGPQPQPPAPDLAAPKGKLAKLAFKGGKVRLTLRLDEAATVTFRVDGKQLAKRTLKAGTRKLALKPKKKLKRGRHTLTAIAVDGAGNRAKTLKKRFRVR
jgi:hypothetical protein